MNIPPVSDELQQIAITKPFQGRQLRCAIAEDVQLPGQ